MKSSDVYLPEYDEYLNSIEEEYKYYNWEEQEYSVNRLYYEYDLEYLTDLPTKEKMRNG